MVSTTGDSLFKLLKNFEAAEATKINQMSMKKLKRSVNFNKIY